MSKGYSGMFFGTIGSKIIAGEVLFISPNYKYFDYISKRKDIDPNGIFDVVAHGMPNAVQIEINGVTILASARDISRILIHKNNYKKSSLLDCYPAIPAQYLMVLHRIWQIN